jgi:sugar (pentulose or hexulose) kinase
MAVTLGLDFGTTSLSAVAVRDDGSLAARETLVHGAAIPGLPTGHSELRLKTLYEAGIELLGRLAVAVRGERIAGLGFSSQMHGGLLVDDTLLPQTELINWQDKRALTVPPDATRDLWTELLDRCPAPALEPTGCRLSPGYLGTTLFALHRLGTWPTHSTRALMVADWFAARVSGTSGAIDPTNAGSTGLFNIRDGHWSEELLQAAGVPRALLPEVRASGAVLGGLTADVAATTGLPVGLPVCNPLGDNQAAVIGSVPAAEPGIQINVGTGGQINWPLPRFARLPGMDTRALPVGRFMCVGAGLVGGDAYAWVQRTARQWLAAFGIERSSDEVYDVLNRLAAELPIDVDGLICDPLFKGSRQKPHARGQFQGITPENFSPGHVALAVLQGIVAGFYSFYEAAGDARPAHLSRIIGSGNGLRKNPLLVQELARRFERPVFVPVHEEEAAYGAALLAGVHTGLWSNLEQAGSVIRLKQVATP